MIPVSIVIVTKDEELHIEGALASARDAAEIIVIDSFSTDRTVDICKNIQIRYFRKNGRDMQSRNSWQLTPQQAPGCLSLTPTNGSRLN